MIDAMRIDSAPAKSRSTGPIIDWTASEGKAVLVALG